MQAPQEDISDFPLEICLKPQPLIGMSGLDVRNNAMHKLIADTFFNNRRIDGIQIQYKLIDNTFSFPTMKPKRNSYEWYVPKGILKRNWMHKHLNCIPAVIAVFYELDWNDTQFNEKTIECASRIQSLRHALEGRTTKITLVLMQTRAPMPSNDDVVATERAATICGQCGLNTKMLFVLPHGDHLQGYAVRLENTFYELSQGYYGSEAKVIKGHREYLNKNTHQYLMVRHQFKMGFLNELKQDIHAAHKHYTHAYNNLLEIRIVDTNANEIRTIAGFVNYKLCRLMFTLNLPRDAISQFKTHTERFKMRLGFAELAFEHYAWLSKQFSTFGDIFDEAVKMGLPAVQTQHPGLYYQQAVHYANLRKKSCYELCNSIESYPSNDPLAGLKTVEFYGQRPWRPGKVTSEPPDPQIESNGIEALQYLEKHVNHSNIIIGLYGLAVTQFKTYKCPRTRRHLVVQMADEYFVSGDYGKALTLLTHMLLDYRTECWWSILSHIVERALICAHLIASIEDFVVLSLELLGRNAKITYEKKKTVYENLVRILSRQTPIKDALLQIDSKPQWEKALSADLNLSIDMTNITTCIDCKCRFLQNKYQADDKVQVEVYVRNECEFPMNFSSIGITVKHFNDSSNYFVQGGDFFFKTGIVKRFIVEFTPQLADINNEISIVAVDLHLGEMGKLVLQFTGTGNKCSIPMELKFFRKEHKGFEFDNVYPSLNSTIVPRNSKLKLSFTHAEPALLGEWYEITIHMRNEERQKVSNMQFEIGLVDDEGIDSTEFSRQADRSAEKLPIAFHHDERAPSFTLCMRAHKIGDRNIYIRATFVLDGIVPSLTETTLQISVVKPFEIATRYLTGMFEDAAKLYADEEFVAMPVINCLSPWPIIIEDTKLEYDPNVRCVDADTECQIAGHELKNGESVAEMYLATTAKRSDVPIAIGQYTVEWRRLNGPATTSRTQLAGPPIDWIPLELRLNVPSHGLVRTPMLIEYHLFNKSSCLVQIDVNIESGEAFMFAGFKQFRVSILPSAKKVLTYNLYPLIAGSVCLPKLVLSLPESEGPALRQEQLNALLQRSLPTHIFVMPQKKGNPTIPKIMNSVVC